MKKFLFILTSYLGIALSLSAQVKIAGHIWKPDSSTVPNASILLHDISKINKPLITFTTSDNKGEYSLQTEIVRDSFLITVKADSYQTIEWIFRVTAENLSFHKNFILHPSISYLDTVRVNLKMSISKTGDTITFNPDAFALKNETTVEDLLSRLPGMEIKEDGKIFFNGRPVNSVLIDGDDLFRRDYQLLTRNAAPKIVDQVQVIKNYQKDQLLKQFNQQRGQAINLKIKDQFQNYLFGNGTLGYGNDKNKQADLFLIRLSPQTKVEAGANYNTKGLTYAMGNNLNTEDILPSENSFFSFRPSPALLTIDRYFFYNIPAYYQDRNESFQGHTNSLFKRNKWENVINVKVANDRLNENQQINTIYQDGTNLLTENTGRLHNRVQQYQINSSKNTKKESVYINASLKNTDRKHILQTVSDKSLKSKQDLAGENLSWQINFNYNKKLADGLLWSTTFGHFGQTNKGTLTTENDFLFWLFPDDLSLNNLTSNAETNLNYTNARTQLTYNKSYFLHEIGLTFSTENRNFGSLLKTLDTGNDSASSPFSNNNKLQSSFLDIKYAGKIRVSNQKIFTVSISNEPHFISYSLDGISSKIQKYFYDYSIGFSSTQKISSWGWKIGLKKQPSTYDNFFTNYIQTRFHQLQSGKIDFFGEKSTYLQGNFNLFSVRMGWIAFAIFNISRNQTQYIMNLETKGIATVNSYYFFPNSSNQMFVILNSQKTTGALPFTLNTNVLYNRQTRIDRFNGNISKSDLQFINTTMGIKSLFKYFINFDYNFSLFYTKNIIKSSIKSEVSTQTILNKLNLFVTPDKLFNTTITLNNLVTNQGTFLGNFLDVTANKKLIKKKLITELSYRNVFNKKFIANTIITSIYTQKNVVELRGSEIFLSLRYEIR